MASKAPILRHIKHEPADGRPKITYRIQLVDSPLIDEAASLLVKHFLPRENICSAIDFASDKVGVTELENIWKERLSEGVSLAAFLEDEDRNPERMISVNVLFLVKKDVIEKEVTSKSKKLKRLFETFEDVEADTRVFERYDCSSYLYGFGLVVHPEYTRRGIAVEMLRARAEVCRITDTPVSATVFTGEASQRAAEKCGYETISELDVSEYRKYGELVYRNPETRFIKYMVKRYANAAGHSPAIGHSQEAITEIRTIKERQIFRGFPDFPGLSDTRIHGDF